MRRQLITRIDDTLHDELKSRARSEGRSLNSLVTDLLRRAMQKQADHQEFRARLKSLGILVEVPPPKRRPPSRRAARAATKGAGRFASEWIEYDRSR